LDSGAARSHVQASFDKQGLMSTLGASILRIAPGEVDVALLASPSVSQRHGFVHAGAVAAIADTAAGHAALTLMAPGAGVLTEFKINLVAPATGERIVARGARHQGRADAYLGEDGSFFRNRGRREAGRISHRNPDDEGRPG
jgi:uncharacterized protein (TIGR00369 family)